MKTKAETNSKRVAQPGEIWEVLPMAWLLIVGLGFMLVALQPLLLPGLPRRAEIPGIAELERLVPPLLLALGVGGIIRRRNVTPPAKPPAPNRRVEARHAGGRKGSESR